METEMKPREHVRMKLIGGVRAEMSICHIEGYDGDTSKPTPILIQNMSPSGLQVLSHLRLPVNRSYMLQVVVTLGEWQFSLLAHTVWRRLEGNHYIYGCALLPDEGIRKGLLCALLAKLQAMRPKQQRIHELYKRMNYRKESSYARLDVRG
ncbi:hypothetical protein [Paenibacillus sp. CF384]|uniref:hypothetical protein n=1 Tax=Paenibacillus sp. CF384 TaxID=1884382 RepID=UPI00089804FE|nr:hypothetical protein [Paenibacillus sp. CF384]SDX65988.1 hypothetical protein SAMN05518855_101843 [Paenibacillus sp. CF384]